MIKKSQIFTQSRQSKVQPFELAKQNSTASQQSTGGSQQSSINQNTTSTSMKKEEPAKKEEPVDAKFKRSKEEETKVVGPTDLFTNDISVIQKQKVDESGISSTSNCLDSELKVMNLLGCAEPKKETVVN